MYLAYPHFILLLFDLLCTSRDHTTAAPIQLPQTNAPQGEVAADSMQHYGAPPSPPTSPALPNQFGQASTSKLILNSNDKGGDKDDHADPLAQFYGKARAEQRLKEDGVSVKISSSSAIK